MPNMSYCRFQNTLSDLQDCYDNIEKKLSQDEHEARAELIRLCLEIAGEAEYLDLRGEDDDEEESEE